MINAQPMATGTVFTNNRTQAVRLPAEVRLPPEVKRVRVRARGNERVLAPEGASWTEFFLRGPRVSEDFLPERAAQTQGDRPPL